MSQAHNQINWCLNKAKKEGKKHRGLVRIATSLDEAKNHLSKAETKNVLFQ